MKDFRLSLTYLAHLKNGSRKRRIRRLFSVPTMRHSLPIKFIFQGMVSRRDVVIIGIVRDVVRRALNRSTEGLYRAFENSHLLTRFTSRQSRRRERK